MGKCKYCGQKSGFLSSKHNECEGKYENGKAEIVELVKNTFIENKSITDTKSIIERLSFECFIKPDEIESLYLNGFDIAIAKFLDNGILSEEHEVLIGEFIEQVNIPQEVINGNASFQKVIKASILRELTEGNIPDPKVRIQGHLPFVFQKSEKLIWLFQDVDLYEQKTKTHFQGGYTGVSFRVAKGVYYKVGGFKGHPVSVEEMKYIDTGLMCMTNKHIFFSSTLKNLKVQITKIFTMTPYEDGIVLQKEGVSARPQTFKNIDGWFIYNVISNLN